MITVSKPFTVRTACETHQWDEFVARHPGGSLYHTTAMIHAFRDTDGYEPLALAAINRDGEMVGLLVAVKVSLAGIWPKSMTSRSIFFAEPIVIQGDAGRRAIACLLAEHDAHMSENVVFSEIRPLSNDDPCGDEYVQAGYEQYHYNNYELDLTVSPDEIFRRMSPKRRNNIRANQRRGLTVREADPGRDLPIFYEHLLHSHARSKVPLVEIGYFEQIFARFPKDHIRLTMADFNGQPIASACHFIFNGRVYWSHAGTYRIPGIAAQASLVWESIQWAIQNQHRVYDFAGAGWAGEKYGPGIFKERFGGRHVNVGRYRKVYSQWRMKVAETGYRITRPLLIV
ncbi:lipid II:glycine glycyltransferase FemX [Neorhodopirellula pilleata]|uniref:FemAB family protein n=1 Tax=Neorhodopirellula pilleata TaxID=2714738 RepID=A0A5C6AHH4_9BACT|nr:peptidoglycan bridge formation glycyltransferase FemA/FemB family protein [Neorhodopirellula pilleata]TWT98708.1 FemAB family protein [Neorhodopirellula pilleata]